MSAKLRVAGGKRERKRERWGARARAKERAHDQNME